MMLRVEQPEVIEYIGYNEICANARFVFDRPFKMEPEDLLELVDGCFHLIAKGQRVVLSGKWDR